MAWKASLGRGGARDQGRNTRPGAVLRASYPAGAHVNGESPVRLWTTMEGRDGVKAQGWSRRDPRGIVKSAGDAGRRPGPCGIGEDDNGGTPRLGATPS